MHNGPPHQAAGALSMTLHMKKIGWSCKCCSPLSACSIRECLVIKWQIELVVSQLCHGLSWARAFADMGMASYKLGMSACQLALKIGADGAYHSIIRRLSLALWTIPSICSCQLLIMLHQLSPQFLLEWPQWRRSYQLGTP